MADILEKIIEAKERIGDEAALIIAEHLKLENFNPVKLVGSCPFGHSDSDPSFKWDKRRLAYKCFSCSKSYGILDMYTEVEGSRINGIKRLFNETGIEFNLQDMKTDRGNYFEDYNYPTEESLTDIDKVIKYLGKRKISQRTIENTNVGQDKDGNVVFHFYDIDGTLLNTKYRSNGLYNKKRSIWFQKNANNCPILYNIQNIDLTQPLLITEGEIDTLSCIEAGYTNVVSMPRGAADVEWINFNYDFLDQFSEIILWFDNDKAGENAITQTVGRLGEYRCKIVKPNKECEDAIEQAAKKKNPDAVERKTDANNILVVLGPNEVLRLIGDAKEIPSKRLKFLMECEEADVKDMEKISTGFKVLDKKIHGNLFPCFTIYTGYTGAGKSSLANIMSVLSPIEQGYKPFIFSGELSEGQLLNWLTTPLAGYNHIFEWRDPESGAVGYSASKKSQEAIKKFHQKDIILYSDLDSLDTSGTTIIQEMEMAYKRYGCRVFLIDNLMCVNFESLSDDKWVSQSKFIKALMNFALKYTVNVNLVIHPRKPDKQGNQTAYELYGASEVANLCHRMFWINRIPDGADDEGRNVEIKIIKDRPTQQGNSECRLYYDRKTRRIYSDREEKMKQYKWELNSNVKYNSDEQARLICNLPEEPEYMNGCDQM